jgi:hypothetical protein
MGPYLVVGNHRLEVAPELVEADCFAEAGMENSVLETEGDTLVGAAAEWDQTHSLESQVMAMEGWLEETVLDVAAERAACCFEQLPFLEVELPGEIHVRTEPAAGNRADSWVADRWERIVAVVVEAGVQARVAVVDVAMEVGVGLDCSLDFRLVELARRFERAGLFEEAVDSGVEVV